MANLNFSINDRAAFVEYLTEKLAEENASLDEDKQWLRRIEGSGFEVGDIVGPSLACAVSGRIQGRNAGIEELSFRLDFIRALSSVAPNQAIPDFKVDENAGAEESLAEVFEAAKALIAESENLLQSPQHPAVLLGLDGRKAAATAEAETAAFRYHQLKTLKQLNQREQNILKAAS